MDPGTDKTVRENSQVRQVVAHANGPRMAREVTAVYCDQTILGARSGTLPTYAG
jgi:hypothetical protein